MVCTKCGELMDQTDKNTFSGRVIREHKCGKCGHTDWEDDGVALWQVLHDDYEEQTAAQAEREQASTPVSPPMAVVLPLNNPLPFWGRILRLFRR